MDSELSAWRVDVGGFADVRLMAELQRLACVDRKCEARILVLLAEVDERKLLVAEIAPKPDVNTRFRKMPARRGRRGAVQAELVTSAAPGLQDTNVAGGIAPVAAAPHAVAAIASATKGTTVTSSESAPPARAVAHAGSDPRATAPTASGPACVAAAAAASHSAAAGLPLIAVAGPRRAAAASALERPRASCAVLSPGRYRLDLTVDQALFDQLNRRALPFAALSQLASAQHDSAWMRSWLLGLARCWCDAATSSL